MRSPFEDMQWARGEDDPILVEQVWPLPCERVWGVAWSLRYADRELTRNDALIAASVIEAYCTLLTAGTSVKRKLSALRRVRRRLQRVIDDRMAVL